MLRVYLDENKWIELSRVRHSHPSGECHTDVFRLIEEASSQRIASFPLSLIHYMENWKSPNLERRKRLAETKLEISRGDRIAPNPTIVNWEVDQAVHRLYGQVIVPPQQPPVFGTGFGHLTGRHEWSDGLHTHVQLRDIPKEYQGMVESLFIDIFELTCLMGPDSAIRDEFIQFTKEQSKRYIEGEQLLNRELRVRNLIGNLRNIAIAGWALGDIRELIEKAFQRIGKSADAVFTDPDPRELVSLLRHIPSRWVDYEILRLRHENPSLPRQPSDLNDVAFLSIAIAYCDVVVTERNWVHFAARAEFERKFGTKVFQNLADLIPLLL